MPSYAGLSRIRQRLPLELHQEVFNWVLKVLAQEGLLTGKTVAVDATTLEANAVLRSIVRRDTGEGYDEYLEGLAQAEGIETPTRMKRGACDARTCAVRTRSTSGCVFMAALLIWGW